MESTLEQSHWSVSESKRLPESVAYGPIRSVETYEDFLAKE